MKLVAAVALLMAAQGFRPAVHAALKGCATFDHAATLPLSVVGQRFRPAVPAALKGCATFDHAATLPLSVVGQGFRPAVHVALKGCATFDHAATLPLSVVAQGFRPAVARQRAVVAQGFSPAILDRPRVLTAAARYLKEAPVTITAFPAARSAGGPHDFFSEGDYWWPDPKSPSAPYVRRDGESNPDNFVEHRRALMRLSVEMPALTAAWTLTRDDRYAAHARRHLRAWFVDPATRMNPDLRYAQAIHGVSTGRGTGIIDTIHLVEVARAIEVMRRGGSLPDAEFQPIRAWFGDYLRWMTTHPNGIEEREAKNNHGTCWVMQAAACASLTGDRASLEMCRTRFKTVLVPTQMAADGSFPLEIERTKPYGYSLFNLDAMATTAHILSTSSDNLWTFELPDGRGLRRAMAFMTPFIADKRRWTHPRDVQYFDEWPMRHAALLFGGLALGESRYVDLWKTLKANSDVEEVVRNFFIRQPVLWVD